MQRYAYNIVFELQYLGVFIFLIKMLKSKIYIFEMTVELTSWNTGLVISGKFIEYVMWPLA